MAAGVFSSHLPATTLLHPTSSVYTRGVADVRPVDGQTRAAAVSAKCFFQLRHLRRIGRSLDDNAVATLVHAFVASRVDYCGSLFVGTPKKTTDKLQRVLDLNAAVRLVSNTRKQKSDAHSA